MSTQILPLVSSQPPSPPQNLKTPDLTPPPSSTKPTYLDDQGNPIPQIPQNGHGASGSWDEAPWYDQPLPQHITNVYQKAKSFLTKPLATIETSPEIELPIETAKVASRYLKSRGYANSSKVLDAYTGAMEGEQDITAAMSSPMNLGMMFSLGKLKALGAAGEGLDRLISAGFSTQMLHQAYEQLPDVKKAIDSGNWEDAARAITSEAGNAVLGLTAAHGAVSPELAKNIKEGVKEEIQKGVNAKAPATAEAGSLAIGRLPGAVEVSKPAGETENGVLAREALANKYGSSYVDNRVTSEPSFILPNGNAIYLGQTWHPAAISSIPEGIPFTGAEDALTNFINEANTIRVRPNMGAHEGETLHITVPKNGVTPEQVDALKKAASQIRRGNLVFETADKPAFSRNNLAHPQDWQFKTANDVDKILSDIGVHPDQKKIANIPGAVTIKTPWAQKAAQNASGGFSVNPKTGEFPTSGKILSILPEKEVDLGHHPTAEDIRNYYMANKALFDKYPELYIGGYGNELNISAIGPNAEKVAKKLDQQAIYDLEEGKEIFIGGANAQKQFPNYSLSQRLSDLKAIDVTPKGSAVPLLEKPLPLKSNQKELTPSEKIHKGIVIENPVYPDFQKAMGEWVRKTAGDISKPSAVLQRSVKLAHNEINHWIMENGGEGKGWFRHKTDAAIKALTPLHPELKDSAHAAIFKALWTAHSYGNDPKINMKEAEQNLTNYEKTGKIAMRKSNQLHWSGHSGNVYTLSKIQYLIDEMGEDGAAKWLTTKHTWPEIQEQFKDSGLNVHKKSIHLDDEGKTYGSMAFGPKGGAFFLNLNGINDYTTVDIWGARALRRWEGREGNPDTLETDPKTGLVNDKPPTTGEIERFHNVISSVAQELGLDTDDVQALQWYFEHKLYEVHGVGEKARDYEEAAKNVVREKEQRGSIDAENFLKSVGKWKQPLQSRRNAGTGR